MELQIVVTTTSGYYHYRTGFNVYLFYLFLIYSIPRVYEMKKCLGEGGFAKVYHVLETVDKEQYALKVIQCKR